MSAACKVLEANHASGWTRNTAAPSWPKLTPSRRRTSLPAAPRPMAMPPERSSLVHPPRPQPRGGPPTQPDASLRPVYQPLDAPGRRSLLLAATPTCTATSARHRNHLARTPRGERRTITRFRTLCPAVDTSERRSVLTPVRTRLDVSL